MRTYQKFFSVLPLIIVLLCYVGCDLTSQNSDTRDAIKMGSLTLDLATSTQLTKICSMPVTGGEVTLEMALVNIVAVELSSDEQESDEDMGGEDQEGNDGEQEGDHQDNDDEDEDDDVLITGPFPVDLSSGSVEITSTEVPAGSYTEVELILGATDQADFGGHTILISGSFTSPILGTLPLSIVSNLSGDLECGISGDVLIVEPDAVTQIRIIFDLVAALDAIDFSSASISDAGIVISSLANADLLEVFEAQLSQDEDDEYEYEGEG